MRLFMSLVLFSVVAGCAPLDIQKCIGGSCAFGSKLSNEEIAAFVIAAKAQAEKSKEVAESEAVSGTIVDDKSKSKIQEISEISEKVKDVADVVSTVAGIVEESTDEGTVANEVAGKTNDIFSGIALMCVGLIGILYALSGIFKKKEG